MRTARASRLLRGFAASALCFSLVACDGEAAAPVPDPDAGPMEVEVFETLGRLSVADDAGEVQVWDLDQGSLFTTYTLEGPATLVGLGNRQITAVVALQEGRFDVFATGVRVWDHVDHFHVFVDPTIVGVDPDLTYEGGVDTAAVQGGWVTVFDRATGVATALLERSIGDLRTDRPRVRAVQFRSVEGAPHAGTAIVSQGHLLTTRAEGGIEARQTTANGLEEAVIVVDERCASPAVAGGQGPRTLFRCDDGDRLVQWDPETEGFVTRVLEGGATGDDPTVAGHAVLGEEELEFLVRVGAGGVDRVAMDGAVAPLSDEPPTDAELDRDGRWLVTLTAEGLVVLDPETGEEQGRVAVDGGADLALGEARAYVARPEAGEVVEIDLATLAVLRTFAVGGRPQSLVVTALWPGGEPVDDL